MRTLLFILLTSCAVELDTVINWTDYEYQTGDNSYIAFSDRHFYYAWYNSDNRGEGVTPNLRCIGDYTLTGAELTLYPREGEPVTYYIYERENGQYAMYCGADCVEVWVRTKYTYIR